MTKKPPTLTVIVPAHQAVGEIGACLDGLLAAGFARDEILVVDDGSSDGTGDIARASGVSVLHHAMAKGPAEARNAGVDAVPSDIILFVDADVVVHQDLRQRVLEHFRHDPHLAAVFGSYDDRPSKASAVSFYRNLLHHFVHQRSHGDAATFWTGIGAVRRADFMRLGGLEKAWQAIEDVAFGVRLHADGGRILLDKELLGTHLKVWSVTSMFRTDLVGRAIPWSRLILFHGGPRDDLNFTIAHRISLAMVALMGVSLVLMPFQPVLAIGLVVALFGFFLANRSFLSLLKQRGGLRIAVIGYGCHVLHYLAGGLGLSWVLLTEYLPRRWRRQAAGLGGSGVDAGPIRAASRAARSPEHGVGQ